MLNVKSKSSTKKLLLDKDILNILYPVGAIYLTLNNNNPQNFLGGQWQRFSEGRVLLGVGSYNGHTFNENTSGGDYTITLSTSQIPAHNHNINCYQASREAKGFGVSNREYGFHDRLAVFGALATNVTTTGGVVPTQTFSHTKPFIAGEESPSEGGGKVCLI